jgi:hypothetical protein
MPGWPLADHHCDFIAYAAPVVQPAPVAGSLSVPGNADTTDDTAGFRWRIRLLDAPRLRDTARREHERWADRYGRKLALNRGRNAARNPKSNTARNPGYRTSAIPSPGAKSNPSSSGRATSEEDDFGGGFGPRCHVISGSSA